MSELASFMTIYIGLGIISMIIALGIGAAVYVIAVYLEEINAAYRDAE